MAYRKKEAILAVINEFETEDRKNTKATKAERAVELIFLKGRLNYLNAAFEQEEEEE